MPRHAIAVVVAALTLISCGAVLAQEDEVIMGGYFLFKLRCPVKGMSVEARVDEIQRRVDKLLSSGTQAPIQTRVVGDGANALVYAADMLIVTVMPCDARANRTTTMGLANVWAGKIRTTYPKAIPKKPGVAAPGSITYPRAPR